MYNVCHKCGLPRAKKPNDTDLGNCICIGQSWFEYEELERTEQQTRTIAREHYTMWVDLFTRQNRECNSFERLDRQYAKALGTAR